MPAPATLEHKAEPPLWQLWLGVALVLVLAALPQIAAQGAQDPDDYMRLLQVRALLDGQAWFDTRQYRLDPPFGADMHWVRLVDLPIAAALALFRTILSPRLAEAAAMIAVPLGQLYLAMALLRALMRDLGLDHAARLWALVLIPLFPLLSTNLMPMRIDHHGWQAIAALAAAWMAVRGGYRAALIGGGVTAAWLYISLEGMALSGVIGAVYAWRYWQTGARDLESFLIGLALAGLALLPVLVPVQDFAIPRCDLLSWPHFLAFGASALTAVAARVLPGQASTTGRLMALLPIPPIALAAIFVPVGRCAVSPMAMLDPVLRNNWQAYLQESAPIWQLYPSAIGMLVVLPLIVLCGFWLARKQVQAQVQQRWLDHLAITIGACAISLLVMRGGITAQLLALPFAGMVVAELFPRARAVQSMPLRIIATVAAIAIATPALPKGLLKQIDPRVTHTSVRHPGLTAAQPCDLQSLDRLPPAHLFADLDITPEILVRTRHSAITSGYHRNEAKLLDVVQAFGGPLAQSRNIVAANHAAYVVACKGSGDLAGFANMGHGNLADLIYADRPPEWLVEDKRFSSGSLRVYQVR